jgi:hypothetical protein
MMTIKFGAGEAGAKSRYGSGSVFLCTVVGLRIQRFGLSEIGRSENGRLRRMVAFGEWSFREWSPPEIGRSEIGHSEIGRSENGRSENGWCTFSSFNPIHYS